MGQVLRTVPLLVVSGYGLISGVTLYLVCLHLLINGLVQGVVPVESWSIHGLVPNLIKV